MSGSDEDHLLLACLVDSSHLLNVGSEYSQGFPKALELSSYSEFVLSGGKVTNWLRGGSARLLLICTEPRELKEDLWSTGMWNQVESKLG